MFEAKQYSELTKQHIPCECCRATSTFHVFHGDRYNFGLCTVICKICGLIYTSPRPSDQWFDEFYRLHYRKYYESVDIPDEKYLFSDWIIGRHNRNLGSIAPYLSQVGKVIDLGSAEGTFLNLFTEHFPSWTTIGIEPSEGFSKFARDYYNLPHIVTGNADYLETYDSNSIDLITASHVLEHLLYPSQFFQAARNILKDGAYLFVDVPDAEGLRTGIGNLHIGHTYHFTENSLNNFLTKYGFEPVFISRSPENKPWTIQIFAKKLSYLPVHWEPRSIDYKQVAKRYAKLCRTPIRAKIGLRLRPIKQIIRNFKPKIIKK